MVNKAQHSQMYIVLPSLLRELRETCHHTQRSLGRQLHKAQSWVYNCETGNRRVDVTEFIAWAAACNVMPEDAFRRLLGKLDGATPRPADFDTPPDPGV
jgi:hypothetical protein